MSEIIRGLVSPSVRAAEKLPPTIKTQSLKNQLLRGGAKPVELDYAALEKWAAQQGERVKSEDVVRHLRSRGPLGRIKRLDAEIDDKGEAGRFADFDPDEDEEAFFNVAAARSQRDDMPQDERMFTHVNDTYNVGQQPRVPSDTSKPFDQAKSWPYTQHGAYTETDAWNWHPGNYREVMWFDPEAGGENDAFSPNAYPQALDTHVAHVWVRYHNNPNALDVQNIQSDIGQTAESAARMKLAPPGLRSIRDGYVALRNRTHSDLKNEDGYLLDDMERLFDEHGRAVPMPTKVSSTYPLNTSTVIHAISDGGFAKSDEAIRAALNSPQERYRAVSRWLLSLPEEERAGLLARQRRIEQLSKRMDTIRYHGNRFADDVSKAGFLHSPQIPYSTGSLVLDGGNWRQLPLRHLLLESAAQGGKPIHLPLGINVSAVEEMPRRAASQMYEKDMPAAFLKALKSIGGGEARFIPGARKKQVEYYDEPNDRSAVYTLRVGPDGQRAGTSVTPSKKAIEHINKHGLDFLSLLLLTGAGAAAQQEQQK